MSKTGASLRKTTLRLPAKSNNSSSHSISLLPSFTLLKAARLNLAESVGMPFKLQ